MAFWNRKKNPNTDVPVEIQEYYQTEKRERAGIAWLLALGTLIVTIALAVAIFFAGRWVYRQIAGDDNNTTETAQTQNENQSEQSQQEEGNNSGDQNTDNTNQDQQNDAAQNENNEGQVDEEAAVTDENHNDAAGEDTAHNEDGGSVAGTQTDDQSIAQTGDSMPNTGPGDTLAIFVAISVLGYLGHRLYNSKITE